MSEAKVDGSGDQKFGTGEYVVKQGECLISISVKTGHVWETIWNDPDNQDVKENRKDPASLFPGDRLHIPDLRLKEENLPTDQLHRFVRKSIPSEIHLILRRGEKPRANEPYTLTIDGLTHFSGETTGEGEVRHPLSPLAKKARLLVGKGVMEQEYTILLGHMDPINTISGVQGRLGNLGFDCGRTDGVLGQCTIGAIQEFQNRQGLSVTGELDDATKQALEDSYGS